jgi:hypothetical protein
VGSGGRDRRRRPPARAVRELLRSLEVGWAILAARDPQVKGVLERSHRFMRTNFEPGRRFANHQEFQDQFDTWAQKINGRVHRTTRAVPADRLIQETARMRPCRRVEVRVSQTHVSAVVSDTGELAAHHRRVFAGGLTIVDPAHQTELERQRARRRLRDQSCRQHTRRRPPRPTTRGKWVSPEPGEGWLLVVSLTSMIGKGLASWDAWGAPSL